MDRMSQWARRAWGMTALSATISVSCGQATALSDDPALRWGVRGAFADQLVDFSPGDDAGFGQESLPDVVLGPPQGEGEDRGSLDVLSLGVGGVITLKLARPAVDGPGADLIVFENPFVFQGTGAVFAEPGEVLVSEDGEDFVAFPCTPTTPAHQSVGCAGREPVYLHVREEDGALVDAQGEVGDALDPTRTGGDAFDFADIGVSRVSYVRVVDRSVLESMGAPTAGFDLDAVVGLHTEDTQLP